MRAYRIDKKSIFKGEDKFNFDMVNNEEDVIISFEEETKELIKNLKKEVKEYTIKYLGNTGYVYVYQGHERIDWGVITDDKPKKYSPDYGNQIWDGWVSFTDGSWIERRERNSCEWWEYIECPSIEKELEKRSE